MTEDRICHRLVKRGDYVWRPCGKPAVLHILWGEIANGYVCEEHREEAVRLLREENWHRLDPCCGILFEEGVLCEHLEEEK